MYKLYQILVFNGYGKVYRTIGHKQELRSFRAAQKVVKRLLKSGIDCYMSPIRSSLQARK